MFEHGKFLDLNPSLVAIQGFCWFSSTFNNARPWPNYWKVSLERNQNFFSDRHRRDVGAILRPHPPPGLDRVRSNNPPVNMGRDSLSARETGRHFAESIALERWYQYWYGVWGRYKIYVVQSFSDWIRSLWRSDAPFVLARFYNTLWWSAFNIVFVIFREFSGIYLSEQ